MVNLKKVLLLAIITGLLSDTGPLVGSHTPDSRTSPTKKCKIVISPIDLSELGEDDPLFGDSPALRFDLALEEAMDFFNKHTGKTSEPLDLELKQYDIGDSSEGRVFGLFRDNPDSQFEWK